MTFYNRGPSTDRCGILAVTMHSSGPSCVPYQRVLFEMWFPTRFGKCPGTTMTANAPLIMFQMVDLKVLLTLNANTAQQSLQTNAPFARFTTILIVTTVELARRKPYWRSDKPLLLSLMGRSLLKMALCIIHPAGRSGDMMLGFQVFWIWEAISTSSFSTGQGIFLL